jgi:hypothetical protein
VLDLLSDHDSCSSTCAIRASSRASGTCRAP